MHTTINAELAETADIFKKTGPTMLYTFVVYVENKPGVLNRVASLFRRRGFNIESLTVGPVERPGVSRMTVVVDTDEHGARRVEANLYKLVPVRQVANITHVPIISRDLAMIKVAATGSERLHVMQLAGIYRARIVDVAADSLVIEATGTEYKINSLLEVLRPHGVIEMARTGRIAMARGAPAAADAAAANQAARAEPDEYDPSRWSV